MRINRLVLGVLAVPVVIATGLAVAYAEIRLFGMIHWQLTLFLAGASGCGVFLLADRLGVLAEPHSPNSFLRADEDSEAKARELDSRPIVPR